MFLKFSLYWIGIHVVKQEVIVVDKDDTSEAGPSNSRTNTSTSANNDMPGIPPKPKGIFPTVKKIKSFVDFRKAKGKQWKKCVSSKNSDDEKSKERNVCINIVLLEWNIKERILFPLV